MRWHQQDRRFGTSLIEVLVVLGIVGILCSLLLAAIRRVRAAADRTSCQNNLRQIGIALHNFHGTYGQFPPLPVAKSAVHDPNNLLSWMALLLPQMDQVPLYQASAAACQLDIDVTHNPPHIAFATVVPSYVCPADSRLFSPLTDSLGVTASFSSYVGILGAFEPNSRAMKQGALGFGVGGRMNAVSDGLSNSLLAGERPPPDSLQAGWWYPGFWGDARGARGPNNGIVVAGPPLMERDGCGERKGTFGPGRTDNPCDRFHLWSLHGGGANFLFADGAVRFLTYDSEPILIALTSRSGGEIVDIP